ncbi:REP-associated tyrosine transposase [Polycyclovorans algicola]|uniref:REP-associated tyrosine transposase n=1 Tax=Polycyclovorans algicola TaxID=616992 RepID=UPI0004A76EE3|nr:transposase [Polycyclovorans algicola]
MPQYTRATVPGGTFFFTVVLLDRQSQWLTTHIDALRDAFRSVRARHPFSVDAIVVLPDHFHSVWTLPPGDADFSTRMRQIKSPFSRSLPNTEQRSASQTARAERGIWQRRYWEHVIRDADDLRNHVDYIHYNPVKHGHVRQVSDWPYSSFHRYVKMGIYPPEWGGTVDAKAAEWE